MRSLPFNEALAICDSALRADAVTPAVLLKLAEGVRGAGRARARRVATLATSKAANPFESAVRAVAIEVPGLAVEAQLPIRISETLTIHPDLGDPHLRIAIEAESFAWHGDASALTRDCARYNELSLLGWLVIRFSWWQVMRQPAYVRQTLIDAVALRHAEVGWQARTPA